MRFIAGIYRLTIAFFCFAGTYETWLVGKTSNLVYFTHETNIALGIVMIWAGFASLLKGVQPPAWLKGMLTLNIIITGLVAWLVLPPTDPADELYAFGIATHTMAHVIVPIMAVADFLIFDEHRKFKWHYTFSWMLYYPIYLAFVLIRAHFLPNGGPGNDGSPYPYDFINLPKLGMHQFVTNCAVYLGIFFVLAWILFIIDHALPRKTKLTGTART